MANIYKSAYNELIDILERDYQSFTKDGKDPYCVCIPCNQLKTIENMVKSFEDAEDND
jgi:hypothetical protein